MSGNPPARRRDLVFTSLDQVMPDVDRLQAGHITVGCWSLGMICNHLATTIGMSMDGVPIKYSWLIRRTFGVFARQVMFWRGRIPKGVAVPDIYLPKPSQDAIREAEALRTAIARLQSHTGPFDEHPILGSLSVAQWKRFHCIHCAHHLSCAVPR